MLQINIISVKLYIVNKNLLKIFHWQLKNIIYVWNLICITTTFFENGQRILSWYLKNNIKPFDCGMAHFFTTFSNMTSQTLVQNCAILKVERKTFNRGTHFAEVSCVLPERNFYYSVRGIIFSKLLLSHATR